MINEREIRHLYVNGDCAYVEDGMFQSHVHDDWVCMEEQLVAEWMVSK